MRGKEAADGSTMTARRITPAYAGKRRGDTRFQLFQKDHPRLCGEKLNFNNFIFHKLGSPPPMRGKVEISVLHQPVKGITPAYAGKRLGQQTGSLSFRDHPRLCGEKLSGTWSTTSAAGSPPPMRGKDASEKTTAVRSGITPAYAGKR